MRAHAHTCLHAYAIIILTHIQNHTRKITRTRLSICARTHTYVHNLNHAPTHISVSTYARAHVCMRTRIFALADAYTYQRARYYIHNYMCTDCYCTSQLRIRPQASMRERVFVCVRVHIQPHTISDAFDCICAHIRIL